MSSLPAPLEAFSCTTSELFRRELKSIWLARLRYGVVNVFTELITPSLVPFASIESTL
jgi:hypothetical protein